MSTPKKKQHVILIPDGGLCNRMHAIESFAALCGEKDAELTVKWRNNWQTGIGFEGLFEPTNQFSVEEIGAQSGWLSLLSWKMRLTNKFPWFGRLFEWGERCTGVRLVTWDELKRMQDEGVDARSFFAPYRKVVVMCWWLFYGDGRSERVLKVNPTVGRRIEEEVARLADRKQTIGVHIRRTDNKTAIHNSPLELFVERMEREVAIYPDVRFYVASDSEEVKQELSDRFGQRVVIPQGVLARNSTEGMIQAAVELYTLAACRLILASSHSTFSYNAAQIGGIPYEEISISNPTGWID